MGSWFMYYKKYSSGEGGGSMADELNDDLQGPVRAELAPKCGWVPSA